MKKELKQYEVTIKVQGGGAVTMIDRVSENKKRRIEDILTTNKEVELYDAELKLLYKDPKRKEYIERLRERSDKFSQMLAWGGGDILMTPATEFYRLYRGEIEEVENENELLKTKIKELVALVS